MKQGYEQEMNCVRQCERSVKQSEDLLSAVRFSLSFAGEQQHLCSLASISVDRAVAPEFSEVHLIMRSQEGYPLNQISQDEGSKWKGQGYSMD